MVQIFQNIIFIYAGYSLIRLLKEYHQRGYFDEHSLRVLNGMIISCIGLGALGAVQIVINNFNELHFSEWTSTVSIVNLLSRSFINLLIFQGPQTIYFLLALVLWSVKMFVARH